MSSWCRTTFCCFNRHSCWIQPIYIGKSSERLTGKLFFLWIWRRSKTRVMPSPTWRVLFWWTQKLWISLKLVFNWITSPNNVSKKRWELMMRWFLKSFLRSRLNLGSRRYSNLLSMTSTRSWSDMRISTWRNRWQRLKLSWLELTSLNSSMKFLKKVFEYNVYDI